MRRIILIAAVLGAACRTPSAFDVVKATAELRDAAGAVIGSALFIDASGGIELEIEAAALTPGPHGLHIHEHGRCEPPSFESAGKRLAPAGAVLVPSSGAVKARMLLPSATFDEGGESLLRPGGAALVIDAGGAEPGARAACGVITKRELRLKRLLRKVRPVAR